MTISGYTVIAPVCEVGDLVLYRATRTLDGLAVLLKVPAAPRLSPIVLRRLEHEYELARDLDPGRIARPLVLERQAGDVALVLEQGGDYLAQSCWKHHVAGQNSHVVERDADQVYPVSVHALCNIG